MDVMAGGATHGATPRESTADHGVQCARERGMGEEEGSEGRRTDTSWTRSEALGSE